MDRFRPKLFLGMKKKRKRGIPPDSDAGPFDGAGYPSTLPVCPSEGIRGEKKGAAPPFLLGGLQTFCARPFGGKGYPLPSPQCVLSRRGRTWISTMPGDFFFRSFSFRGRARTATITALRPRPFWKKNPSSPPFAQAPTLYGDGFVWVSPHACVLPV